MDRNNEKPSCERGARNASKLAQKDPPASIGAEEATHNLNLYAGITLEAILEPSNLKEALKRVVANRGAPGIDGMEVGQLLDWIRNHPGQLTKTIKEGTYRPSPVKRVSIPKDEPGKFRDLRIQTVIGRLVQQATAQVLDWAYDRDFSHRSFGFRRNMRAHHALRIIAAEADQGYRWAVEIDIANNNVHVILQQSRFKQPGIVYFLFFCHSFEPRWKCNVCFYTLIVTLHAIEVRVNSDRHHQHILCYIF